MGEDINNSTSPNHHHHPDIIRRKQQKHYHQNSCRVVDIGVNLTDDVFKDNWRDVVQRAVDSGVDRIILTGLTVQESLQSLIMTEQWFEETGCPNLYATVGVHPYNASSWKKSTTGISPQGSTEEEEDSLYMMRELLRHPLAVAVGECGLDYNRFHSSKEDQIEAFRQQVRLACELDMPLFLHEREAHVPRRDFRYTRRKSASYSCPLLYRDFGGSCCICQTGIFHKFCGNDLFEISWETPAEIVTHNPDGPTMVETDAPYMNFKSKERPNSEPADCVDVARKMGETLTVPFDEVCDFTTETALNFFRIAD
eukprot:CAMPEP_0117084602 /NCGR_PEP_ID=MMETSP0472-20121206/59538_1 /TAXON_ID=693140 ORGANISM="Tiarina fusus, Strain LIS" /NCGR_SAMPLE_ID=MMETSP0472 /ASSEMBLY_ACC=CAM_ASM_000603 /LENGTH=310 /DNA_ID=CAMNT_0004813647 /DNA_START=27 /DNA_END=960 /DNA_ORIENTATION=+